MLESLEMKRNLTWMLLLTATGPALAAPITLTDWTVQEYPFGGGGNVEWTLEASDTVARQNRAFAPASILLSDFSIDHATTLGFSGTFGVDVDFDDDQVGFVFGYQDMGNLYLFQWKADPNSSSDPGMHLRRVTVPGGGTPTGADFEGSGSTPNSLILAENELLWSTLVTYEFSVIFTPTGFDLTIDDPTDVNDEFWSITDTTFTSGKVGFYNASQADAVYQADALTLSPVPVPSALILFASGFGVLGWLRRPAAESMR